MTNHALDVINLAIDAVRTSARGVCELQHGDATRIEAELRKLHGKPALFAAVFELCLFATYMAETLKAPTVRDQLLAIAATAADELIRLGGAATALARDLVSTKRPDFGRYTGATERP